MLPFATILKHIHISSARIGIYGNLVLTGDSPESVRAASSTPPGAAALEAAKAAAAAAAVPGAGEILPAYTPQS